MPRAVTPAQRPTVLVLDDDTAVLSSLQFALDLEGFDVRVYRSGAEILAVLPLPTAVCLIVDFRLSDGDGLAVFMELRNRGVALPTILITTAPSPRLQRLAAEAGIVIVEKPELGEALLKAIHRATGAALA